MEVSPEVCPSPCPPGSMGGGQVGEPHPWWGRDASLQGGGCWGRTLSPVLPQHLPASVPAPQIGSGLPFGTSPTSRGCGVGEVGVGVWMWGCLLRCLSPAKGNTERRKAPKKIYTCLINVKCSLQTGVTSTSLYNIHRHTIIDTPEYRFVQLGFFGQR